MERLAVAIILVTALYRLHMAHKEAARVSEYIALGAIAGAIIAAWFRRSARWLLQIVAGSWIGYVSGHWLGDFMNWPLSIDYQMMAGTITGCMGYSLLEAVLSPQFRAAVKSRIAKSVDTVE